LWESAKEYFPMPAGVKPFLCGKVHWDEKTGRPKMGNFYGNTWKNEANAQHKRRCLFINFLPRMNGPQLYLLKVPFDDWSVKLHKAISKRVERAIEKAGETADYGWLWVNNALQRGYYLYLTSAPGVSGFAAAEGDVEPLLGIRSKRFAPQ